MTPLEIEDDPIFRMTPLEIENIVYRWHEALCRDLVAGRILAIQLIAGIEAANAWGIARYADLFSQQEETDLCPTTSF